MDGWPIPGAALPIFGPDGTIYTSRRVEGHPLELFALDARGKPKPGWPVRLGSATSSSVSRLVAAADFLYATACDAVDGCSLHRINRDGAELAPWPIPLGSFPHCSGPVIGPNGSAYATCSGGTDAPPLAGVTVAVTSSGAPLPGWPARIGGRLLEVGPDGTAYVASWKGGDVIEVGRPPTLTVTAIGPSGRQRLGWPVAARGELVLFDLRPGLGLYLAWWEGVQEGEGGARAQRTVFTVLRPDGSAAAGWPRSAAGGSSPDVGDDGTLSYATSDGNVYVREPDGSVRQGWPFQEVGAVALNGNLVSIRPDGSIVVAAASAVTWLDPAGRVLAIWGPGQDRSLCGCWGDTPCAAEIDYPPVFAPDETAYVVVHARDAERGLPTGMTIVAIDPSGHVKSGWPKAARRVIGSERGWLLVGPDGHIFVLQDAGLTALTSNGMVVR